MKKLLTFFVGLCFASTLFCQTSMEITTSTPMPLCPGLNLENMAMVHFGAIDNQVPAPADTRIEYVWTVEHQNGTWTWHNYTEERLIPIPWSGIYKVQIKVMYFRPEKTYPYAVFFSNPLFLQGMAGCGET